MYNILRGCRRPGTADSCQALCARYDGTQSSALNDHVGCHPVLHCATGYATQRGQFVRSVHSFHRVLCLPYAEDCARVGDAYCGQRLDRQGHLLGARGNTTVPAHLQHGLIVSNVSMRYTNKKYIFLIS